MFKKLSVSLLLLLGVFTFSMLMRPGFFPMHDDMQAMRILQMRKCFEDWQLPCRWVPDMGYGYGYPQFHYYPPFPYYLMTTIHLLGVSIIDSVKIGFILSFVVAGIGMYLLGRKLWGPYGGVIAALFYLYLPYRSVNVYDRGAMGEIWAMSWFPWIVWSMEKIFREKGWKPVGYLGISLAGLFTSHLLSTMMIAPFLVVWWSLRMWQEQVQWKELLAKFGLAGVAGLGLAAFYVFPSLVEKPAAHLETLTMGYFNYLAHFASIRQMLTNTHWGYGSSLEGPWDDMSFLVGLWHWVVALMAWLVAFRYWRKTRNFAYVSVLVACGFGYLLMVHPRSTPIWNAISLLEWLQFPWRFLAPASFVFSLVAGSILVGVKKVDWKIFSLLLVPLILLNITYMRPRDWYPMDDATKFSGELWDKQQTISIYDYLPIDAEHPPTERAPEQPWFVEGEGTIKTFEVRSNSLAGSFESEGESVMRLPQFYFPGWQVKVDGQIVPIDADNELGLMTFSVAEGTHSFVAKLKDTPIRTASNTASLLAVLLIMILVVKPNLIQKYVEKFVH